MEDNRDSNSQMVAVGDAARLLGVSVKTIRRWEASGKISGRRTPGGQRRFRLSGINELLGENE